MARHCDVGKHVIIKLLERANISLQALPGGQTLHQSGAGSRQNVRLCRNAAGGFPQIYLHKNRALNAGVARKLV